MHDSKTVEFQITRKEKTMKREKNKRDRKATYDKGCN